MNQVHVHRAISPRGLALAPLLLVLGLSPGSAVGQPIEHVSCDAGAVRSATEGVRGYGPRGDRCEGTFNREVAGASLRAAGFYRTLGSFDGASDPIPMTWSAPDTGLVHLRVRSVREGGELYGLDTQLRSGTKDFLWPADFIRLLRLESGQLAPGAFLRVDGRELYLPLRITATSDESPVDYTLILLAVERMERMFVTVAPVRRVGDLPTGDFVIVNQELPGAPFTSSRPIFAHIPAPEAPGLYVAQVLGLTSDGNRRELNTWFYNDADPSPAASR